MKTSERIRKSATTLIDRGGIAEVMLRAAGQDELQQASMAAFSAFGILVTECLRA